MDVMTAETTWKRLKDGTWGIRSSQQLNAGETTSVTSRKGISQMVQVLKVIWSDKDYCICSVKETDLPPVEETKPEPVVQQPIVLKKGDTLEKSINGTVKQIDPITKQVTVLWQKVIRSETMLVDDVVDGTLEQGETVAQSEIDNLQAKYETQIEQLKDQLDTVKGGIHEVHLKDADGETIKVTKGLFHEQFTKIVALVQQRMNVFIYGPTGCGKSHICKQVAESLNLRFAFVSCTSGMSEGVLGGRLLPTGKSGTFQYVISEFIDCYENGGLFLLDEIDAADPNVLLLVNAALANGHVAVPNRPEKPYAVRHADFVCVAAANTVGTGADRLYSGRNKLDAATLDRFAIGKVLMGYDERVETDLCPDSILRTRLQKFRKAILEHKLERAMSTRFMRDAYKMMSEAAWTMSDVEEAFFSGWRTDEVAKVKGY